MWNLDNVLPKDRKSKQIFYLTKDGVDKLKKEYEMLLTLKRSKTGSPTPQFLHSDELDPEYIALRDDLDLLEVKLADLKYVIKNAKLIKAPLKQKQDTIQLGAKVLFQIDGQEDEFTIVGTIEANPFVGKISNESPVGRAVLGHRAGEEVVISSPIKTHYKIKKIRYD